MGSVVRSEVSSVVGTIKKSVVNSALRSVVSFLGSVVRLMGSVLGSVECQWWTRQ